MSAARPNFLGLTRRKSATRDECARRSSMTIASAVRAAYRAGESGEWGGFDAWLCERGLQGRSDMLKSRMREAYRAGVSGKLSPTAKAATRYKGVSIYKVSDGYVTSVERDSVLDSLKDAKAFIDSVRGNPGGIVVAPSYRHKGKWDVIVGGIQRVTKPTLKGAEGYARRLARETRMEVVIRNPGLVSGVLGSGIEYAAVDALQPSTRRNKRANSSAASDRAYEAFHGHPPQETVVLDEEIHEHRHLASVGKLLEMVIRFQDGSREFDRVVKGFGKDALLTMNEGRTQLYLTGGDQSVDPADFGIDKPFHEFETLGRMVMVGYFTTKTHLKREGGTAAFYHCIENCKRYEDLSDHGRNFPGRIPKSAEGVGPDVIYDCRNKLLSFSGGSYTIPDEGIEY